MTQVKKSTKRHKKKPEGFLMRHAVATLVTALAALTIIIGCAVFMFRTAGGTDEWIYVTPDMTPDSLRSELADRLGDNAGHAVYTLWRLNGGNIAKAHGAYRVAQDESRLHLARRMAKGRQTPVTITFNNIRTLDQLTSRLASRLELDAVQIEAAFDSVLPQQGFTRTQYPAALLPDSYEVYWTTDAPSLLAKLIGHRNEFWNDERRRKAADLGLTPIEVATIASIVEEETAKKDEMGTIARLYVNRLKRGMKLQADPTVKYAAGRFDLRRIAGAVLRTNSPYNTYINTGLPPGPIRIAEASTIDSVLNAPVHSYIYMCAREDFSGYHNFAVDYATHRANAAKYQAELNRRNIR